MIEEILSTVWELVYSIASNFYQIVQTNPLFGVLLVAVVVIVMLVILSTVTNWGGSMMKLVGVGLLIIFIILGIVVLTTEFGATESISDFLINWTAP